MIVPGEYPSPLGRVTNVEVPMVSGYVTSRVRVADWTFSLWTNGTDGLADNLVQGIFENTSFGASGTNFTLAIYEAPDDGPAWGTRSCLVSGFQIVPGGHVTKNFAPGQPYLEFYGVNGSGNLRVQMLSKLKYEELGFDKSDPFYPPQLWQGYLSSTGTNYSVNPYPTGG